MPYYQRRGKLPRKRHVVFRGEGGQLLPEELVGNKGFSGPSSLLHHLHAPTAVKQVGAFRALAWQREAGRLVRHRHFFAHRIVTGPSPVLDRVPLLFNSDVAIQVVAPRTEDAFFFRNAEGDEVVYVAEGEGCLDSPFGALAFRPGDYVVIPRGIVHRWRLATGPFRFVVIESRGEVRHPRRYLNEAGQLTENAPFCERDLRLPQWVEPVDEKGDFRVLVKHDDQLTELVYAWHPFDVVGWDGYYYPHAFSIHDFEPRVARIHLPPPVHQTYEGDGWVICSFCPRPFDFDPEAVPAPYAHQNVMSDEVLYYASSEFMSRKGIELGSVTLHPDGLPHGPQPGRTEASIGARWTNELAVMLDTFRPLHVSQAALQVEDEGYWRSWLAE